MPASNRSDILRGAEEIVNNDRNAQYGEPIDDFTRSAKMISGFLGIELQPWQVPIILGLVKVSRIAESPKKFDSWMDWAGYASVGWDVVCSLKETSLAEAEAVFKKHFDERIVIPID